MQTSMGLSKILILVGARYTSTILVKKGKFFDILGEIQSLVKGMEKNGESSESDSYVSHAIASQECCHDRIRSQAYEVHRLAMEVRQLASTRQITVLNGNSGQIGNMTSLIVPAVAVGALCYGCMWWKGLTFSDLMYVTKRNMANAVSNLTKHLESNKEVTDVRGDLSQIGFDLDALQRIVSSLDGKIYSLEDKQGLKEIVDSFVSRNANRLIIDGTIQEGIERLDDRPRTLMRIIMNV
ncbi:unnamed protein product [Camellia sinensis]